MRSSRVLCTAVAGVLGLGLVLSGASDALACGGDFVPPNEDDSPVTTHRMILSVSQEQTTLYDEIEFKGSASSFAWVLPIKGTATVGLSADLLFSSLDSLTETQVVTPPQNCPPPPACEDRGFNTSFPEEGVGAAADAGSAAHGASVTVTAQQQVGPYETVQLHSTDPGALNSWLTGHGYAIPDAAKTIVSDYVAAHFDFLAMKLAPGKGVTAMRPVRVTTPGASPVLPLRMVSVGTGATTGITLWVVADGRWEPQNFPFFRVKDSEIAWNWNTSQSTYEAVRMSKEAALGGRGWEVESSLELSQYTVTNTVLTGGVVLNNGFGGGLAEGVVPATGTYLPVGDAGAGGDAGEFPSADAGEPTDGGPETADQARQVDLTTLFAGIQGPNARITRLRTDIAHAALSSDLELTASSDQSEESNVRNPGQQIGEPICPVYNTSCEQIGTAPRSEAAAISATTPSGSNGGGGCSTADTHSPLSRGAWGAFLGLLGLVAVRSRSRSRRAQR